MSARERRDVTGEEIAEAVGVSAAAYSRWEKGQRSPKENDVAKLAAFFGVTPAYLRYGIAPSAPTPVQSAPLPTIEELAEVTGARATKPRNIPLREIEHEAEKKKAAHKGGRRRA